MKSGLWYLRIAVSNVRGPPSVVPFVVMPAVLLSWVVGVMLVAGPASQRASTEFTPG